MVMLQEQRNPNEPMRVTLVEVKYCADTSWEERHKQACEQHATLETKVRDYLNRRAPVAGQKRPRTSYMQAAVQTVVLLIGVTGTTYQKYTLDPLVQNLGLDHDRAKRLLLKLTRHSLEHAIRRRNFRSCPANQHPG
jgi:hypothetical protein